MSTEQVRGLLCVFLSTGCGELTAMEPWNCCLIVPVSSPSSSCSWARQELLQTLFPPSHVAPAVTLHSRQSPFPPSCPLTLLWDIFKDWLRSQTSCWMPTLTWTSSANVRMSCTRSVPAPDNVWHRQHHSLQPVQSDNPDLETWWNNELEGTSKGHYV